MAVIWESSNWSHEAKTLRPKWFRTSRNDELWVAGYTCYRMGRKLYWRSSYIHMSYYIYNIHIFPMKYAHSLLKIYIYIKRRQGTMIRVSQAHNTGRDPPGTTVQQRAVLGLWRSTTARCPVNLELRHVGKTWKKERKNMEEPWKTYWTLIEW